MFILTLGILHGSNDIKLIQKFNTAGNYRFTKVLFLYIGIVFSSVIFFAFIPKLALPFFVIVSAYHFGEQHLSSKLQLKGSLKFLLYGCYGLVIFSLLFYTNAEATSTIIFDISGLQLISAIFYYAFIVSFLIFTISIITLAVKIKAKMDLWEEAIHLAVFYIIFANASLLWSFAIYFIVWHSLPSLTDQIALLYGKMSKINLKSYLKSSLLYWIVSVIGIYILYVFTAGDERLFNQLFFSFIAAVTFPHVLVIHRMYKGSELS